MIHGILIIGINRFDSGVRMLKSAKNADVRMHVIWRGFSALPKLSKDIKPYFEMNLLECSISQGRNILISHLLNDKSTKGQDIVCFADDDGYWNSQLPSKVNFVFSEDIPWTLGIYGPSEQEMFKRFPKKPRSFLSFKDLVEFGSSLGIYVRVEQIRKTGFFDESLGLGTKISIGEDLDYLIRLKSTSKSSNYRPQLFQIHNYGSELSNNRINDSLEFYLYLKSKGTTFSILYFRRILGLLVRGNIALSEGLQYCKKWTTITPN